MERLVKMALYLTKLVNGQVQKLRVSPTKALYRGYWAVIVGGFAGTSVTCNGVTKFIGSSERVAFNIITPGTYTFTATRQGTTITKEVTLNDDTQEYIINLSMFIGMQQLKYIESTGTQYIDTGFTANQDTKTELDAQFVSGYGLGFGAREDLTSRIYTVQKTFANQWRLGYNSDSSDLGTADTNRHLFVKDKNLQYIDGILVKTDSYANFTTPASSILFGHNQNGTPTPADTATIRVYSCKIYDNGTLVRDFIPVKDDTGRGALYDEVTQQIFYNSGTGDFICGPNKPYTRIQYLESTGTQWIDSGVTLSNKLAVETVFQTTSVDGQTLFGDSTYYNNNQRFYLDIRNNNFRLARGDNYVEFTSADTNKHTLRFASDTTTVMWDGNPITVGGSFSGTSTDSTLKIFTSSPINPDYLGHVKYYSFKMYKNDELVRDFVPVLDYDGVPCMYDKVEEKLYYNQGTGEFIAGPEKILPDEYVELEYLQSSGTQWIDTGVNLSNYHTIDITVNANKLEGVMGRYLGESQSFQIFDRYCRFGNYNYTSSISQYEHETVNIRYGQTGLYVNNVLLATPSQQTFTQTGTDTCLVGHYGGTSYNFSGKIYSAQIYDRNNTLVRDLIPVKRISDNVLGMYDTVSTITGA